MYAACQVMKIVPRPRIIGHSVVVVVEAEVRVEVR
jgi:hypothetical protein